MKQKEKESRAEGGPGFAHRNDTGGLQHYGFCEGAGPHIRTYGIWTEASCEKTKTHTVKDFSGVSVVK